MPDPEGVCIAGTTYASYPAVIVTWDAGDAECGDGICNGDEDYNNCPEDCDEPGDCGPGYLEDCVDDDCAPESWCGDGYCDGTSQEWGADLCCYDLDCGDCTQAECEEAESCEDQGLLECPDGSCVEDLDDCPDESDCVSSFMVYGSDPNGQYGSCWDDGSGYFYFYWEGGCLMTTITYSGGSLDVTSYGFTEGFYFYGFDAGVTEDFTVEFEGGETASETATNDCASCEEQGQIECWDGSCADSEEDCPEEGDCGPGYVLDCDGSNECWPESWIGDGYPDCEDQQYGADLTCYDCDGGDCPDSDPGCSSCEDQGLLECPDGSCVEDLDDCPEQECPAGTVPDCSGDGDCIYDTWIGDGYCDGYDQ